MSGALKLMNDKSPRSGSSNYFQSGSTRNLIQKSTDRIEHRMIGDSLLSIEKKKQNDSFGSNEKKGTHERKISSLYRNSDSADANSISLSNIGSSVKMDANSVDNRDRRPSVS